MTNDPDRRVIEHDSTRKRFTSITVDPYPRTKENAKIEETRRIDAYAANHSDRKPRYNKIR